MKNTVPIDLLSIFMELEMNLAPTLLTQVLGSAIGGQIQGGRLGRKFLDLLTRILVLLENSC